MGPGPQEEAATVPFAAMGGRLEASIPEGCLGEGYPWACYQNQSMEVGDGRDRILGYRYSRQRLGNKENGYRT